MRREGLTLVVAIAARGCTPRTAPATGYAAPTPPGEAKRRFDGVVTNAVHALTGGNAASIRSLFGSGGVVDGGLWFDDEGCRARFARPRTIPSTELDDFAACLAPLHLQASRRWFLPTTAILRYEPGIEIEASFAIGASHAQLVEIGFVENRLTRAWLPTVTPEALEAARSAGESSLITAEDKSVLDAEVARSEHGYVASKFRVCIDRDGRVTSAVGLWSTSYSAAHAFRRALTAWTFHPFHLGGQPIPVCSTFAAYYPLGRVSSEEDDDPDRIVLPPLDPNAEDVPIGKHYEWGSFSIATAGALRNGGVMAIALRFCTDAAGKVTQVEVYDSTGDRALDEQFVRELKTWRYVPTIIDGRAVPACEQTTFTID